MDFGVLKYDHANVLKCSGNKNTPWSFLIRLDNLTLHCGLGADTFSVMHISVDWIKYKKVKYWLQMTFWCCCDMLRIVIWNFASKKLPEVTMWQVVWRKVMCKELQQRNCDRISVDKMRFIINIISKNFIHLAVSYAQYRKPSLDFATANRRKMHFIQMPVKKPRQITNKNTTDI